MFLKKIVGIKAVGRFRFGGIAGCEYGKYTLFYAGNASHPLTEQYQELDDINEYTAPFHHDPNTTFNDDEVMAHAKRKLKIVGGCGWIA